MDQACNLSLIGQSRVAHTQVYRGRVRADHLPANTHRQLGCEIMVSIIHDLYLHITVIVLYKLLLQLHQKFVHVIYG